MVTDEDIANESKAEISSLSVGDTELTALEGQDYQYETSLPEGTTSTTIAVETEEPNALVEVERIDSLAYETSNIKRLSAKKTLDLNSGDNYFKITVTSENNEVENEYVVKISVAVPLVEEVFITYSTIYENPTLTTSSNNTSDVSGLYKSTETNDESPTYYFRGEIENNYVSFAGFTWRIVRINEDGTIRLIMQDGINDNYRYAFASTIGYTYMYYSNSKVRPQLETWYTTNIVDKGYSDYVTTGDYFCEQAKVKYSTSYKSGSAVMTVYSNYLPNFKCLADDNGYGIVNSSIGLITYDEVVYAGGYYNLENNYYLNNSTDYGFWSMSASGIYATYNTFIWGVESTGGIMGNDISSSRCLRPVISLKADTSVTGDGTSSSPWIVFME